MQNWILQCKIQWFLAYSQLDNHYHKFQNTFIIPQRNRILILNHSSLTTPRPWKNESTLCLYGFFTFNVNAVIQYVAFCVWLFHLMFQVHVCHSVYQYIIPFSGRVILHYMDRQQLIDSSIEWFPPFGSYGCLTVCFFPLFLLRHKWYTPLHRFKVYSIMIWLTYLKRLPQ